MSSSNETNKPEDKVAACCASFYEKDVVQQLLGTSFHPGGPELSERLIQRLDRPRGARVLDVACGVGTTSRMMAEPFGLEAVGLDFSMANVERATAASANVTPTPTFVVGSADDLPFDDGEFDAVVCECAVSTFADQPRVAAEFLRVLKPGGLFGMTDMVVDGELPPEIAANIAPWTCMAAAHSVAGYQQLMQGAGFALAQYDDESPTLLQLATELKRKLVMAGVGQALGAAAGLDLDIRQMRDLLAESRRLVEQGTVGYCSLVFSRGVSC